MKISLLTTSSGFCTSPWTFSGACSCEAAASWRLIGSPSSPKATARAMALVASATSRISALSAPLACGKRRRCSIRYCVSVRRLERGMAFSSASVGSLEHPARQDVLRRYGRQVGFGESAVALGEQARSSAQAHPFQCVAHTARVGKVRLLHAPGEILLEGCAGSRAEAIVLRRQHLLRDLHQFGLSIVGKVD